MNKYVSYYVKCCQPETTYRQNNNQPTSNRQPAIVDNQGLGGAMV